MEILITGATGFLGQRLCKRLSDEGHLVTGVASKDVPHQIPQVICDLTKENEVSKLSFDVTNRKKNYDMIYHLAAWTRAGDFCLTHSGEQWITNQKINTNVLSWWKENHPDAKMITMGTSCAYDPIMELKEENYLKGVPIDSLFSYAMTKRMLYAGLLALNKQYGMKYMCFVPSTLYGETYHLDNRQPHFIFDLSRKIVRGYKFGERVTLWGDGYQRREVVHVDDAITAMISLSSYENDIINIGTGSDGTIREFANIICKDIGYDFNKIEFDETKYVGAKSKCLNIEKMQQLLPNLKITKLQNGIERLNKWFMEHEK